MDQDDGALAPQGNYAEMYLSLVDFVYRFASEAISAEEAIQIEVLNESKILFDFSMKYAARRKQIHIRSAVPVESLRIMDSSKEHRSYDVKGSSLIMLPKSDFHPGSYLAELKFQKNNTVVLAKIEVLETLKPSDL